MADLRSKPFPLAVRLAVFAGAVLLSAVLLPACVTRIEAGHVGIRIKLAGSARGVQNAPLVTGWVAYNPLTETIVEFPVNVQNVIWTKETSEGAGGIDESITFASSEGVTVNADVGLAFHIEGTRAPVLYARFREADVNRLAHGYVRNVVREALGEVASTMPVQDIYGAGKTRLIRDAQKLVSDKLTPDGFVIDQLTFASALRLPQNVVDAINRAIEATQSAIQAENRVRQIRAEAEQAVAEARGLAEAARQRAGGDADATIIRARAEAQANEIIRLSTTAEVLQYRMLGKWDGQLPVVTSGNVPMLTLESSRFLTIPEAERRARLRELLGAGESNPTPATGQVPTGGGAMTGSGSTPTP